MSLYVRLAFLGATLTQCYLLTDQYCQLLFYHSITFLLANLHSQITWKLCYITKPYISWILKPRSLSPTTFNSVQPTSSGCERGNLTYWGNTGLKPLQKELFKWRSKSSRHIKGSTIGKSNILLKFTDCIYTLVHSCHQQVARLTL